MFESIEGTRAALEGEGYFADEGLATGLFLSLRMGKALFLEGEPGVGKTEVARVLSAILDTPLIRLQCYEGLDINHAVYEWNYPRQLLAIQARAGASGGDVADIFSEAYLLRRPLLQAIDRSHERAPVLLIDELDRADEEFESFLLELLGDFQITIPELGTFRADHPPVVIITSNRTREIHDALKRRCIYHWIDYPGPEQELRIVQRKVPEAGDALARQVVAFVQALRDEGLYKLPGVAESLDWARALTHLAAERLDPQLVDRTLGLLLKYQDDVDLVRGRRAAEVLATIEMP
ncbi:MAG TPA: MoxR family ATPase [Longimicrobiales bacterium]|nr:MoxR family ATPase [Longimicrobiales bacterium]